MQIAGRKVGSGNPPYIIAEVSCNHGGSIERALELIDAAHSCGADAVKFQAYTAETITMDCDRPEFTVADGPWKGRRMFDLYREAQTPFEWFPQIKMRAEKVGITWFASCFDRSSVDLMVELGAPAIKIASFEIVDTPLIRYAAATGKPLIISTGMANMSEIMHAIGEAPGSALLWCVSGYPPPPSEAGLLRMRILHRTFSTVGISDHTIGPEVPIAATALGATIIEKHFRLSFHPDTEDSPFSLDEVDFLNMVKQVHNTWAAMQPSKADSESAQRPLRRSLFAVDDIAEGEAFTEANVRSIRPGHGLPPAAIDQVVGKTAARNIVRGEPLDWEMVQS